MRRVIRKHYNQQSERPNRNSSSQYPRIFQGILHYRLPDARENRLNIGHIYRLCRMRVCAESLSVLTCEKGYEILRFVDISSSGIFGGGGNSSGILGTSILFKESDR